MNENTEMQRLIALAQAEVAKLLGGGGDEVQKTTIALAAAQFGISLEEPAKQLIPFLPTWVQTIPRKVMGTGNTHTYKRITGVSVTGKSTAAEGVRGGAVSLTTDSPSVNLGIISSGLFDVTLEAEKAAGTFDDALARVTSLALLTARRYETAHILGGNRIALGSCGTVTCADNTAVTGTLANVAHYVYVKAMTAMALQKAILANACILPDDTAHCSVAGKAAVIDQTDGYGVEGTVATATPTLNKGLLITWDPVPGAAAYAVFASVTTGITNVKCQGVIGQTRLTLTALNTAGSAGPGDNSADTNDLDGVISLLAAAGSGAYLKNQAAKLTAATGNGIPEIDTMLGQCYLQQLGMDDGVLVMGIMDRANITKKLGAGSATSIVRVNIDAPNGTFTGSAYVDQYIHPITGRKIRIETDPNLYYGTILWIPTTVPYIAAEVGNPLGMWMSYDWLLLPYALINPKREYEARMRGGLACYIPPAFGMLYNIYNG